MYVVKKYVDVRLMEPGESPQVLVEWEKTWEPLDTVTNVNDADFSDIVSGVGWGLLLTSRPGYRINADKVCWESI